MENQKTLNPALAQSFKLGVEHLSAQRWTDAELVYRQMASQWPNVPEIHHNLGVALKNQGKLEAAVATFQTALDLRPGYVETWVNLAETLRHLNRMAQAIDAYRRTVELRPNFAEAWNDLGITLRESNQLVPAMEAYRQAAALRPDFAETWNNLGVVLRLLDRPTGAADAFRRALALRQDIAQIWSNMSVTHKDIGELNEALACVDRAIALQPGDSAVFSNRVYTLPFHPAFDGAAIFAEARQWNQRFALPLSSEIVAHANVPSPQRRLRIGYVSGDFRRHCQALFMPPLLSHHDHREFEIFCYSSTAVPDVVTARLKGHADTWRDIARLDERTVAQIVRQDKIDILVDLTLHMASNKLKLFARKPAPVQVTWLAYPGTTGLDAIDYRLTDPRLDPPAVAEIRSPKSDARTNDQNPNAKIDNDDPKHPGPLRHSDIGTLGIDSDFGFRASDFSTAQRLIGTKEPYYSERSIRLPDSYWCYDPYGMADMEPGNEPSPGPLPARAAGHITFGCLNNFCKVTQSTLNLWAGVMAALPNSQLVLLAPEGPHRERVLYQLGVSSERVKFISFQPRRQYLEIYRRIDLSLDTIPYNGHTTSLDSMWMGVPVVTRVGHTVVGRAGWSQLYNLELTELVARSDEQFVQLAVALAGDLDRLDHLRTTLRQRMRNSPLMDGPRFARNVEAAYRQMWQQWCRERH